MAKTAQLAAWVGRDTGFQIREDPAPGAALITIALATVRGSVFRWQADGHIIRNAIALN